MSLNSWKKEFYKGRLRDAARDPLTAVEHSLKKWEGLLPKNLATHDVEISWGDVCNPKTKARLGIDSDSCALCKLCRGSLGDIDCNKCPIVKVTGKVCDGNRSIMIPSPYGHWVKNTDPKPMIKVLKQVRKALLKDTK